MLRKTVEILALASLLFMFILSVAFPESAFMWLATASSTFTLLRIVLITILATLLITDSFFDHRLHWFLGIFAVVLSAWSLASIYNNQLQILDGLSFLAGSIAMAIEALEPRVDQLGVETVTVKQFGADMKHRLAIYTLAAYVVTKFFAWSHPYEHSAARTTRRPSAA